MIKQITNKYTLIRALDYAIQRNGLKIFILLRLSPLIPFKTINYVAGGTSVTFRDYCISLIAMIPGIVLGVVIGASMSSLTEAPHANDNDKNGNRTIAIIVSVIGVVFSIAAMILVTIYTRKELNKAAAAANINNNYTINDTTNDEVILENDTVQASERLTESDVVDALVDAIHDVQAHALAGMNGEGVHVGCNNNHININ